MAQRMILCAKTWTWLMLSLEVIQKSHTMKVNNLTNMFYKKFVSISLTSFSNTNLQLLSYKDIMYHNFIGSIINYFGGL